MIPEHLNPSCMFYIHYLISHGCSERHYCLHFAEGETEVQR